MSDIAPNASYHYWGFGIKGDALANNKYAQCSVLTRGLDFEDGNEISTETDEGHTGGANLDMGSYRSNAESQPQWNDAIRYGEGIEDIWFLTLGSVNRAANTGGVMVNDINGKTYNDGSTDVADVYTYAYEFPPSYAPELPHATIYNGYAKTVGDARVFNNSVLNELEVTFSNEELPRYDATFISDYNNFNMINPSRTMPSKSLFVKPKQVNVYYADVGTTDSEMLNHKLGCFIESSFTINNNYESQTCQDDEYGKNNKFMGVRETEGSINLPWLNARKLEPEWEGADPYSHVVSTEITHKQIWYEFVGEKIGTTDVNYKTLIKFPNCEITNVESPKSGDEAKDITIEYKVLEDPSQSFMTVSVITHLDKLHVDNTGVDLSSLSYTEPVTGS